MNIIRHRPNNYTDPKSGVTGFVPDWRAEMEQSLRLWPTTTEHGMQDITMLLITKGQPTPEQAAIITQFLIAAKENGS